MNEGAPKPFGCLTLCLSVLCCWFLVILPGAPLKMLFGGAAWAIGVIFAYKAVSAKVSGIDRIALVTSLLILIGLGGIASMCMLAMLNGGFKVAPYF